MNWNIELIGLIAAVLTTVGFVPQLVKTVKTKDVEGISLTMYLVSVFRTDLLVDLWFFN